jgi:uracil-DNA glycosylase
VTELHQLDEEIRRCQRCRLGMRRTHAVPGEGPEHADIMFIGEAPGYHEDQQGRPFVGAAGNYLAELLASIGLCREDVYITNVVKCRPPDNRDPQPDEIEACQGFLERQIELIKPKIIITLGRFSMRLAFTGTTISRVHGTPKRMGDIVYFAMFHPAAGLHQPRYKNLIEQDIKKLPAILSDINALADEAEPEPPEQLSLF